MSIAENIKDYQTLIASLIAFGAAFVALISAQSVARSQRTTALELARCADDKKDAEARRENLKKRLAVLLELRSDIDVVKRLNAYRIKMGAMLHLKQAENGNDELDAAKLEYKHFILAWKNLMRSVGRMDKLLFATIKIDVLALFDSQTQSNVHFLASAIRRSEYAFKDLDEDIEIRDPKFILGIEIKNLISTSEALDRAEAHLRVYLQNEIDSVGKQLAD